MTTARWRGFAPQRAFHHVHCHAARMVVINHQRPARKMFVKALTVGNCRKSGTGTQHGRVAGFIRG